MRALLLGLAATAALAGIPAQAQQVPPAMPVMLDGTVLEVSADGRTTRVPDLAIVQAGVTIQAASAGDAYTQANAKMAKVIAALRSVGIAERDIQTSNISLQPQYRNRENEAPLIFAYQASNMVTVKLRDMSKAGGVLDVLVREGANTISGPNLVLSQPEAAMDEARVDAVARARARAELYAKAAGLRVDRILMISDSGMAPGMPMPMMRAAYASDKLEVMAGEQEVSVSVTVRFLLK
jgi:uncharacterized protein YggE